MLNRNFKPAFVVVFVLLVVLVFLILYNSWKNDLKENINLTQYFKRYNQIGIICVIGILLCSIFETFVMPILMNLFL